jgi:hypothetical protein
MNPTIVKQASLFSFSDFIIVPICMLVLFSIAYFQRMKYEGTVLKPYFYNALFFKFFATIMFATITQVYYGGGDTTRYYQSILDMQQGIDYDNSVFIEIYANLSLKADSKLVPLFAYDPLGDNLGYMMVASNYMVPKLGLPFAYIFFNSFLCVSLCFAYFSFLGCWRLFRMFTEMYPHLHKQMAIATLFLPSVVYWSSGLLKDTICIGALGYLTYASYSLFIKKRNLLGNGTVILLSGYLLFIVKTYIILSFIPAIVVWIFMENNHRIPDARIRSLLSVFVLILSIAISLILLQVLLGSGGSDVSTNRYKSDQLLEATKGMQDAFKQQAEGTSYFSIGTLDPTPLGYARMFPLALNATLFRPYLWEVRNPIMLIGAVESLIFLVLTSFLFIKIGAKQFFLMIYKKPVIFFCFVFAIAFAGAIAIGTNNFGSLARYKIPCLPYYMLTLFLIVDEVRKEGKVKLKMPDFWYRVMY